MIIELFLGLFGSDNISVPAESSQDNNDAAFVCTVCFEPVKDREPVVSSKCLRVPD